MERQSGGGGDKWRDQNGNGISAFYQVWQIFVVVTQSLAIHNSTLSPFRVKWATTRWDGVFAPFHAQLRRHGCATGPTQGDGHSCSETTTYKKGIMHLDTCPLTTLHLHTVTHSDQELTRL